MTKEVCWVYGRLGMRMDSMLDRISDRYRIEQVLRYFPLLLVSLEGECKVFPMEREDENPGFDIDKEALFNQCDCLPPMPDPVSVNFSPLQGVIFSLKSILMPAPKIPRTQLSHAADSEIFSNKVECPLYPLSQPLPLHFSIMG